MFSVDYREDFEAAGKGINKPSGFSQPSKSLLGPLETITEGYAGLSQGLSPMRSSAADSTIQSMTTLENFSSSDPYLTSPPWSRGIGSVPGSDQQTTGGIKSRGQVPVTNSSSRSKGVQDLVPPSPSLWSYQPTPVDSHIPPKSPADANQFAHTQGTSKIMPSSLFTFNSNYHSSAKNPQPHSYSNPHGSLESKNVRSSWSPSGTSNNLDMVGPLTTYGSSKTPMGNMYQHLPQYSRKASTQDEKSPNLDCNKHQSHHSTLGDYHCRTQGFTGGTQHRNEEHSRSFMNWNRPQMPFVAPARKEQFCSTPVGMSQLDDGPEDQKSDQKRNIGCSDKPQGCGTQPHEGTEKKTKDLSDDPKVLKQEVLNLRDKVGSCSLKKGVFFMCNYS